jgi:hypothetical protein
MKKPLFWIGIMGLASGCIKEFPLKTKDQVDPLPVFHMYLEPDSNVEASFAHVTGITKPMQVEDAATISIYRNGTLLGTLASQGSGMYALPSTAFKPRDSFRVMASDAGSNFEVRGRVPSRLVIEKADTGTNLIPGFGPAFCIDSLVFTDSAVDENYYRLYVRRNFYQYKLDGMGNITDSTYKSEMLSIFGSALPIILNNFNNYTSKEILFSDATLNGTRVGFLIYSTEQVYSSKATRAVNLEVVLENINKQLFDYYNTRNAHLWQQQSIAQLPGVIEGNIPGGYGVIGAFTYTRRVINLH